MYYVRRNSSLMKVCLKVLNRDSTKKIGNSDLTVHYFERSMWKSELVRVSEQEKSATSADEYWFLLYDFETYVDQRNLFLDIKLKYRQRPLNSNRQRHSGLENIGNTCYMNSFIQALFFIKPLRKALFECNT